MPQVTLVESHERSKGYAKPPNGAPLLCSTRCSRTPPVGQSRVCDTDLRAAEHAGSHAPGLPVPPPSAVPTPSSASALRGVASPGSLLGGTCLDLRRPLSFNCVVSFIKRFAAGGKQPAGRSSSLRGSPDLPATSPAPGTGRRCRPSPASSLPPSPHQRGPAFVLSETILSPLTLPQNRSFSPTSVLKNRVFSNPVGPWAWP